MSLTQALATSVTGLRTSQAGLALVAANVANAQTPGYLRKTLTQEATIGGNSGIAVRVATINREFDQYVQRQLRIETSGAAYADLRANFYERLQQVYGEPGAASSFETVFNNFTNSVQALSTSSDSMPARANVLNTAQVLTQQLNSMTADFQSLRNDAERGLADSVSVANDAMRQIASINGQLSAMSAHDAAAASLEDQRDAYISTLAELMDIKVVLTERDEANVFTNSGIQLVGVQASQLAFDGQGTMGPTTQWSADPAKRLVGTLTLVSPNGGTLDMIADNAVRAGTIAAYIEMRDHVLVQAQTQIDQMAAGMSRALSDKTVTSSVATSGAQAGFDLDVSGLLPGNTISLTYTDTFTSQQRQVTIVRVDDPSVLPLKNTFTTNPNDLVIGVDFSGGLAGVATQLNSHFSGRVQFSTPAAGVLRVLDDGAADKSVINTFSAQQTVTTLNGGSGQLLFFTDIGVPYTGAVSSSGVQSVGLAGRISVNAALLADPAKLVAFNSSVTAGDPTRPDFIYQSLAATTLEFSPETGIGSVGTPFAGSLPTFLRQMLSQQGSAAEAAGNMAEGQGVVVNALKQRMAESAGVNVDEEMANLLTLQHAYGANARVMTAVRDMLEILMNMI